MTGAILTRYQEAFAVLPLLVSFVPMLTDTGGNAGSQSSTVIIRSLAIGEVAPSDALIILWKEFRVSIICGLILSTVNFARLFLQYPDQIMMCLTVAISLFVTVMISKIIGGLLPLGAKALKLDPAIMAAPIITTIVDAVSLIVYFKIAVRLLGLG